MTTTPQTLPSGPLTIAIVGRPNVGKSALFNVLVKRRIAIVHDQPGITRDRLAAPCPLLPFPCQIIDTGGIGAILDDGFTEQVRAEADIAIHTADLVLFVVDNQDGLDPVDKILAGDLRKAGVPVILAINKVDDPKHEAASDEFHELGFSDPLLISAAHSRGIDQLTQRLESELRQSPRFDQTSHTPIESDTSGQAASPPIKLTIIGRPNVGKSSLINAILGEQRSIVSDIAGTTRDAIDIPFHRGGTDYTLIDTAGMRPRGKRDSSVEVFSAMRAERSIRRADVVALVIDSAAGITAMDRKMARLILKEHKPCLIVLNKFDLYFPEGPYNERIAQLTEHVRKELFFLHYAPFAATSAIANKHVGRIFNTVEKIRADSQTSIGTGELNRILIKAIQNTPPPMRTNKRRFKLLYATLTKPEGERPIPVPSILCFVNQEKLLTDSYQRYLENILRSQNAFTGLPIRFQFRSRQARAKAS